MSNPIPAPLALDLSGIVNGVAADATPVESSIAALETALNQVLTALRGGTSGQFLDAADGTDVVWHTPVATDITNAANKANAGTETFTGSVQAAAVFASAVGAIATTATVASGVLPITSSVVRITATDGSTVTSITGSSASSQLLFLRNNSGSNIPFGVVGGANGIVTPFTLLNNAYAWLVYDGTQSRWVCLATSSNSGTTRQVKTTLTYGATVNVDASLGDLQTVTVTNTTAFTIANPTNNPSSGETGMLAIEIKNSSGGSLGAVTWGALYKATPSLASITNGTSGMLVFRWNGSSWVCVNTSFTPY